MILIAYILIACSFVAYVILSSIEFGSSAFLLMPMLLNDDSLVSSYVSPIWETVNTFLVFFIISIVAFFPGAVVSYGQSLAGLLFTVLALFALRAVFLLSIYYRPQAAGLATRFMFFFFSIITPVAFSQVVVYAWTGSLNPSVLSIAVALFTVGTILGVSAAFFHHVGRRQAVHLDLYVILCNIFWVFSIANLFWALGTISNLLSSPIKSSYAEMLIAFALILAVSLWHWSPFWEFIGSCSLAAFTIFALFYLQFPFLVYPSVSVYSAFTDPSLFGTLLTGFCIGMALVVPSFLILVYLFVVKRPRQKIH